MFTEQEHKNIFQKQGFIVLPLLEQRDIIHLEKLYIESAVSAQVEQSFYTSIWSENATYRKLIYDNVSLLLAERVSKYISDCEPIFANLHVKKSGDHSGLLAHQDWNFVDEIKHESMTVWCPLSDTNEDNGALQVVPRSQRMNNYVRGRFFDAPFKDIREPFINEKLIPIPMKAGEAIFFHSRLIHASSPNFLDETRVAASVVMVPKGTPIVHDVLDKKKSVVKRLNINPDFFYNYSCYDELANVLADKEYPYHFTAISAAELDQLCIE